MDEANHRLNVREAQLRDLRVKVQYEEREQNRVLEYISKGFENDGDLYKEAQMIMSLNRQFKQELVTLAPVFQEQLKFFAFRLGFDDKGETELLTGGVRVTADLSGKRWLVWGDLQQYAGPKLSEILSRDDALPKASKGRLMERVMCFRPFVLQEEGSTQVRPTQVLVSWDWPRFGGALRIVGKKK
jgi:hypothetical protein